MEKIFKKLINNLSVRFLGLALLQLVSIMPLYATISLDGLTGLVRMPTATILDFQRIEVAFDSSFKNLSDKQPDYTYKVNFGSFENLEIGLVGGEYPEEGMYLHSKYLLLVDQRQYPLSVAVGTKYVGSKDKAALFLTLSKPFKQKFSLHGGIMANVNSKLTSSLMLGFDMQLNEKIIFNVEALELDGGYQANSSVYLYPFSFFHIRAIALDLFSKDEFNAQAGIGISFFM